MPTYDNNLTLQIDLTRAALQALIAGNTVIPRVKYRITDAVGATKVIFVVGQTTNTISGYAINETDNQFGVYSITPDTFTGQFSANPGFQDVLSEDAVMAVNNAVDGAGLDFTWDGFLNFLINASGSFVATLDDGVSNSIVGITPGQTVGQSTDITTGDFASVTTGVPGGVPSAQMSADIGGVAISFQLGIAIRAVTPYVAGGGDPTGMALVAQNINGDIEYAATPGGSMPWSVETTDRSLIAEEGVIANKGTQLVLTLPVTCEVGKIIEVVGINAGLWRIAQNASQRIRFHASSSTAGVTGYLESTAQRDSVRLVCIVADTEWQVISSMGPVFTII